jgi:regulatory protein
MPAQQGNGGRVAGRRPRKSAKDSTRDGGTRDSATKDSATRDDDGKAADGAPPDPVATAKEQCLRLLAVRPRTRVELSQALSRKGIEDETIDLVLARFDEVGLIDDKAFAEQWVRSRHNYSGLARRALIAELRRKGVDSSVAAEAAAEVDESAEEQRARELVRKRLRGLQARDEQTKVRRLVGSLARKGYPEGLAYRVVREELRDVGQDTDLLDELPQE